LGGLAAAVAAVGVVVAVAADMAEEAGEMGRVLVMVVVKEEDRPPLLLLAMPVAADETSRVQACPMALAAAAMMALCCCLAGEVDLWLRESWFVGARGVMNAKHTPSITHWPSSCSSTVASLVLFVRCVLCVLRPQGSAQPSNIID